MRYVHESCLIKWLQIKGTTGCELCLQKYNITYEFTSFKENAKNCFKYILQDKKRLLRGLLYSLYLWIFFRRFIHMNKTILKMIGRCLRASFKFMNNQFQKRKPVQANWMTYDFSDIYQALDKYKYQTAPRSSWDARLSHWPLMHRNFQAAGQFLNMNLALTAIISIIKFLYRVFIFVQMCCLGYGESMRLQRYMAHLLRNARTIKINQLKD